MAAQFSPAGQALFGGTYADAMGSGGAAESEEQKKKRLQAIATAQGNVAGSLSPAGQALFGFGSAGT